MSPRSCFPSMFSLLEMGLLTVYSVLIQTIIANVVTMLVGTAPANIKPAMRFLCFLRKRGDYLLLKQLLKLILYTFTLKFKRNELLFTFKNIAVTISRNIVTRAPLEQRGRAPRRALLLDYLGFSSSYISHMVHSIAHIVS